MAGTYTDIVNELKQAYPTGYFKDPVNLEAPFRARLRQDLPYKISADSGIATFPLYLKGNFGGLGIIADGAAFPAGTDPTRIQGQCVAELFTRSITVGVVADMYGKMQKGTFANGGLWADRVEQAGPYLGKYLNTIYAGSNRGRLATVESDGSNTVVAAKPYGTVNLQESLLIDVYTALSGGSVRDSLSSRTINTIASSTRTVTYSGADQTAVAGDHIFAAGVYAQTPYTLDDIVDDGTNAGTIFTKSRTTYPQLKARVFSNGGVLRNITEQIFLSIINEMRQTRGVKVNRLLSNYGQWQKYLEQISADRRYPVMPGQTTQGVMGMERGGAMVIGPDVDVKLEIDYNIQPRKVYFLDWATWGMVSAGEPDWIGEPKMLQPTTDGFKAAWLAHMGCLENIFCLHPQNQAVATDLADPILSDTVAAA